MRKIAFFVSLIGLIGAFLCADNSVVLKSTPILISLFKNGLGFVTRQADLPKGESSVLFTGLPEVVHGTFWVTTQDATFSNLSAVQRDKMESITADSLADLLKANTGQMVEIQVGDKDVLRGKILPSPESPLPPGTVSPSPYSNYSNYVPSPERSSILILQTDDGVVVLNKSDVRRLRLLQGNLQTSYERKTQETALQMHTTNAGAHAQAAMHYLARGITWAPSCEIDISDPSKARISAKAEILNELEDLEGISVNFITGYPNLQFSDVIDPMAMRGDLTGFINSLIQRGQNAAYRGRHDVTAQQAMVNVAGVAGSEESLPGYSVAPPEGQTREELFFYEQKGVTLKKGERGYYPLYTLDVPYEHVYEWKIPDTLNEQQPYQNYGAQPPVQPTPEIVWHSLRLTNTGNVPWTTAPAMVSQGGQILGQDLINYTSPGGKTLVKITQAPDIQAEQTELEVDRQRDAAKFYGTSYDLVTVRGNLKVTNFKSKDIMLSITKELSGEVLKSLPEAHVEKTARGLKRVNPQNVLTWELPVASRGKLDVEYQYHVYVRE